MADPFWLQLGKAITRRRLAVVGPTWNRLAEKTGLDNGTVKRLETGKPTRTAKIDEVARGLDTTVEALMRDALDADSSAGAPREKGPERDVPFGSGTAAERTIRAVVDLVRDGGPPAALDALADACRAWMFDVYQSQFLKEAPPTETTATTRP